MRADDLHKADRKVEMYNSYEVMKIILFEYRWKVIGEFENNNVAKITT